MIWRFQAAFSNQNPFLPLYKEQKMPTLNHDYFGALNSDALADEVDVLCEGEADVNGRAVAVNLWATAKAPLDAAQLDQFAERLQNLAELDSRARAALQAYLEDDGSYISCHREEMEGGDALPDAPAAFVAAMVLHKIGLWHQDPYQTGRALVLDYMIAPENSDEILAVAVAPNGEIKTISWES